MRVGIYVDANPGTSGIKQYASRHMEELPRKGDIFQFYRSKKDLVRPEVSGEPMAIIVTRVVHFLRVNGNHYASITGVPTSPRPEPGW